MLFFIDTQHSRSVSDTKKWDKRRHIVAQAHFKNRNTVRKNGRLLRGFFKTLLCISIKIVGQHQDQTGTSEVRQADAGINMDVNHPHTVTTLLITVSGGHHHVDDSVNAFIQMLSKEKAVHLLATSSLCLAGKLLQDRRLDIVILYLNSLDRFPIELVKDLINSTPANVVLHVPHMEQGQAIDALRMGVRGFLQPGSKGPSVAHALQCVAAGEIWASRTLLSDAFTRSLSPGFSPPAHHGEQEELTPREQEIVERLCSGLSNKEIARELNISDKTVKTHLQRIYRKNQVHSRLQLALSS